MHIDFELNNKQSDVLNTILALPQNKGKTANGMCRDHVIQGLIEFKKQMDELELKE